MQVLLQILQISNKFIKQAEHAPNYYSSSKSQSPLREGGQQIVLNQSNYLKNEGKGNIYSLSS